MNTYITRYANTLKHAGYSDTKARRHVFMYMLGKEPVSIAILCRDLAEHVDRASVYRIITLFEQLGILRRHAVGWKYKLELTENYNHHHHHLTCVSCKKLINVVENHHIEQELHTLAKAHGFHTLNHQIEITGYCSDCAKARRIL